MLVQLIQCEYDCGLCGTVHRYTDGVEFDTHQDLRTGNKRWIYQELAEVGD